MQDKRGQLQAIEGHMKSLLLALHVAEAQHIHAPTADERRKALLRLTIKTLNGLADAPAAPSSAMKRPAGVAGSEEGSVAPSMLSHEEPSLGGEFDDAADALSRRMGWVPGRGGV